MADAGLLRNESKCKILHFKRGKFSLEQGEITLSDGFMLKSLQSEDTYNKFLGVPECKLATRHTLTHIYFFVYLASCLVFIKP